MKRPLRRLLAWTIACCLVWGSAAEAAPPTPVTVAYTAVSAFLAAFVAKDEGIFERHGLDVTLLPVANGGVALSSVVAGAAQIGGPTPANFLQAVDSGLPLQIVAGTELIPGPSKTGLIAASGSGIHGATDLAGKKIGVPGIGGLLDVILRRWIKDKGGDPARVIFIEAAFPAQTDLLRNHQLDAVASVDPFYSRSLGVGAGYAVADFTETLPAGTISTLYVVDTGWAAAHSEAVTAFRDSLREAVAFVAGHEAAARTDLARNLKLPPEVMAAIAIPQLSVDVTPAQIKFWVDLALEQSLIAHPLAPADLLAR